MADKAELIIESKEKVAYDLANRIVAATFNGGEPDFKDRYLDIYTECLDAVEGNRKRK